ncbi:hypothetical protein PAEPH01_0271 [Pancytospora epiphaga]|nr:hypothetical protein PAEPH01_0271 [Pancytospora epiphaga]
MQINNESESEENKESDRKRRKSKKLKDFVGKVNNKKKKRGISEASEEIVDILSQKEDDDEIVKGLENLLRNPPTRNGDYSSRVEARENSFGKDKDRRRSSHSKTELDIKKDSSTEEEKDDGENYTRNEVKMVHNREQTLLNSGRNSERRSNSIASTESLRNSSFRYKFCNTANSVDSEATTETLMADEYSSTHSSDNETEVSYMIDFYDKIHFNKILVKKMTKFLNRRRKM